MLIMNTKVGVSPHEEISDSCLFRWGIAMLGNEGTSFHQFSKHLKVYSVREGGVN